MGLIKHFNDLLAYLMTLEKVLEMNPFQERPAHRSGCLRSLEAASPGMDGGLHFTPWLHLCSAISGTLSVALLSSSHAPHPLGTNVGGAAVLLSSVGRRALPC